MAMPAQAARIGTPASISARETPQTVAIEEDPFDSRMSDTRRIAFGKSVSGGSRLSNARSASAPCPVSRRPGPEFHFANGKRGKIIVQHETLEGLFLKQQVKPLLVFFRSQRGGRERLS